MTLPNPNYWTNGNYAQPLVANPPKGQRVNNARHAVWHFSEPVAVEIYPAGSWRVDDGRFDRGAVVTTIMHMVVQPIGISNNEPLMPDNERHEGERQEEMIICHLDSHQPENIQLVQANNSIFPNGFFLSSVGEIGTYDKAGFGMIVQWRGRRWRIANVMIMDKGGDEEVSAQSALYRANCTLFTDNQQEMRAVKAQEIIAP